MQFCFFIARQFSASLCVFTPYAHGNIIFPWAMWTGEVRRIYLKDVIIFVASYWFFMEYYCRLFWSLNSALTTCKQKPASEVEAHTAYSVFIIFKVLEQYIILIPYNLETWHFTERDQWRKGTFLVVKPTYIYFVGKDCSVTGARSCSGHCSGLFWCACEWRTWAKAQWNQWKGFCCYLLPWTKPCCHFQYT